MPENKPVLGNCARQEAEIAAERTVGVGQENEPAKQDPGFRLHQAVLPPPHRLGHGLQPGRHRDVAGGPPQELVILGLV